MLIKTFLSSWGVDFGMYLVCDMSSTHSDEDMVDIYKAACKEQGRPEEPLRAFAAEHYPGVHYDDLLRSGVFCSPQPLPLGGTDLQLLAEFSSTWALSPNVCDYELAICVPSTVDEIQTSWIVDDEQESGNSYSYHIDSTQSPRAWSILLSLDTTAIVQDKTCGGYELRAILDSRKPEQRAVVNDLSRVGVKPHIITKVISTKHMYEFYHERLWSELLGIHNADEVPNWIKGYKTNNDLIVI